MTFATIGESRLTSLELHVPNIGPWWLEAVCEDEAPKLASGRSAPQIGSLRLSGTIDPAANGVFGLQRRLRVIGGGGGWGALVSARPYHSDSGVRALDVATDAASAAGESLGAFEPTAERLAADYTRQAGAASVALEDAAGGAPWHVSYDGITLVGERAVVDAAGGSFEVISYDPQSKLAILAVDDPALIGVGSRLSDPRLPEPLTVRALEVRISGDPPVMRLHAWCGGDSSARGRLAGLWRAIARRATGDRVFGKIRYRVVRITPDGERLELQAVRKNAGFPDIGPISMWSGPGIHGKPELGSICLVEFVEGDRSLPIVTAFEGPDGSGHIPQELKLAGGERAASGEGDFVDIVIPAGTIIPGATTTGAIGGTYTVAPPGLTLVGFIQSGSPKVKIP